MATMVTVQRGYVVLVQHPTSCKVTWIAQDKGHKTVDMGTSGNKAYAITDANISLIRHDVPTW